MLSVEKREFVFGEYMREVEEVISDSLPQAGRRAGVFIVAFVWSEDNIMTWLSGSLTLSRAVSSCSEWTRWGTGSAVNRAACIHVPAHIYYLSIVQVLLVN